MARSVQLYPQIEPSVFYVNIDQQVTIHGSHFSTDKKDDGTYEIIVKLFKVDEAGDTTDCPHLVIEGVSHTVMVVSVPATNFSPSATVSGLSLLVLVTSNGRTVQRTYPMTYDRLDSIPL